MSRTSGKTGFISALIVSAAMTGCDINAADPLHPAQHVSDASVAAPGNLGSLIAVALWRLCGEPVAVQYLFEEGFQVVVDDGSVALAENVSRVIAAQVAGMDLFPVELKPGCSKV